MIMNRIVCRAAAVAVAAVLACAGPAAASAPPQTADTQAMAEQKRPDLDFVCTEVNYEHSTEDLYYVLGEGCRPPVVGNITRPFYIGTGLLGAPWFDCAQGRGYGSTIEGGPCVMHKLWPATD